MPATRKAPVRGKWSADHLLQSPKSPLTKINLHTLLSHPEAWSALSGAEQRELISMLPSHLQPDHLTHALNSTPASTTTAATTDHTKDHTADSTTAPTDPATDSATTHAPSRLSSTDPLESPRAQPPSPSPPAAHEPIPHPLHSTLRHNPSFQSDLRLFTEDLAAGKHDPAWQRDAQAASAARAAGTYDAWKEAKREAFWGQKQRVDWQARAGESAEHSLLTLIGAGCFEVGDVWVYRRGVGKAGGKASGGEAANAVEKEALLTKVDALQGLEFRVARGRRIAVRKDGVMLGVEGREVQGEDKEGEGGEVREVQDGEGVGDKEDGDGDVRMDGEGEGEGEEEGRGESKDESESDGAALAEDAEDLLITGIKGPNRLAELLKAEDGRLKGVREANAWKSIRLFRRNQDLGSLWDVRESFHYRREKESQ